MYMPNDVSAVIINYNGGEALHDCLVSLRVQELLQDVIVVDNGSTDGSLEAIDGFPEVKLERSETNLGFAGGANRGAQLARGSVLLFMNPDVTLEEGCVRALVEGLEKGAGVTGPVLEVEASGATEYGARIDLFGYPRALDKAGKPAFVPGCALATPREIFEELGGFDARYFMFVEDVDYCVRVLLMGRDVVVPPGARGRHLGGASTPGGYAPRNSQPTPSPFRVAMRERNSLAMLLKCFPLPLLLVAFPLYVVQAAVTAGGAFVTGNKLVAKEIFSGLSWNFRQIRETLRARRSLPVNSEGSRLLRGRIDLKSHKLLTILQRGFPRFQRPDS